MMVVDEKKVEDVDTEGEDHCYDALRYGLMVRRLDFSDAPRMKKSYEDRLLDKLEEDPRTAERGFLRGHVGDFGRGGQGRIFSELEAEDFEGGAGGGVGLEDYYNGRSVVTWH